MFYYKVDCWVPPRSGFDIVKKNQAFEFIKSIADKLSTGSAEKIEELLNDLKKNSEGLVLKTFTLESDSLVHSPEAEFLEEIQKEYPEAKIASWDQIEEPAI